MALLERFVPRGRIKMWPLHCQLKSHWSPPTDYHWRNAWVLSGCGYGRRDGCLSPSPNAPSITASGHRCVKAWLVCAFAGFDSSRDIEEEQKLHISVLEMQAFQLAPDAFQHGITEVSLFLMSDGATVVAHKETEVLFSESCVIWRRIFSAEQSSSRCSVQQDI